MKSITRSVLVIALLGIPAIAMAQGGPKGPGGGPRGPAPGPGQSEWAPGQRAQGPGDAKDFAPGQIMNRKNVKGQRGASQYAPGHLPSKAIRR